GGTGLSTLLRGLKLHNIDITAIVTVGDDGGSSGRLRTEFNIPPPGDIRNCLVALADNESVMSELFQYRFEEGSSLDGHSFGNLFITALTRVSGSFEQAVVESSRVLAVRGKVLPSTLEDIVVCGEMADGRVIRGESNITNERGTIKRIYLDPSEPQAYDPAIIALLSADVIVLGPGSLYTSVLPNLLVPGIAHAIRCSPATKVYVCNVATQRGETDNFGAIDHVLALQQHVSGGIIDYALVNSNIDPVIARIKPEWMVNAVGLAGLEGLHGVRVLLRDVISAEKPLRHDPAKLASELLELARQARTARDGSGVFPDTGAPEVLRQPVTAGLPLARQPQSKESLR
ncbi:MAG TPA: gluconeogenesis factor YvcK family protein, partial [Nitrolancea sp.]|nr:gluconeogenesis factor YvcK family protein [Nitrolancea sp.]